MGFFFMNFVERVITQTGLSRTPERILKNPASPNEVLTVDFKVSKCKTKQKNN